MPIGILMFSVSGCKITVQGVMLRHCGHSSLPKKKAWAIPAAVEVLTKPLMHDRNAHAMRKQTSSFASI